MIFCRAKKQEEHSTPAGSLQYILLFTLKLMQSSYLYCTQGNTFLLLLYYMVIVLLSTAGSAARSFFNLQHQQLAQFNTAAQEEEYLVVE